MTNCEMSVKDNVLTIKVDLSKRYGDSKSGKTITVATTGGGIGCPENPEIKVGLNVYEKKSK